MLFEFEVTTLSVVQGMWWLFFRNRKIKVVLYDNMLLIITPLIYVIIDVYFVSVEPSFAQKNKNK